LVKRKKLRIVKKVVEEEKSSYDVAKEENILSSGMIRRWVKTYIEYSD
jgi:transposase-like protein